MASVSITVPDGCLRPLTTTESQVAAPRTSASAADIVHAPRQTMPATKSGKSAGEPLHPPIKATKLAHKSLSLIFSPNKR